MRIHSFDPFKQLVTLHTIRLMAISIITLICFNFILFSQIAIAGEGKKILLIETMPVPAVLESTRWFKKGLENLGYIEGQNLKLTVINLNGDEENADSRIRKLLRQEHPDLVVTNATLASVIGYKILQDTKIPMLFFTVGTPVKAGLVKAVGVSSGKKITGKVKMLPSDIRQTVVSRLLVSLSPKKPIRIGYIFPSYPSAIGDLQYLKENSSNMEFVPYQVTYRTVPQGVPQMIEDTIKGIRILEDNIDFWWEAAGPLGELREYTETLLKYSKKPIIFGHRMDSVRLGAIVSLVVSLEANGRETAQLADAILKGQDPGEIPVTPVTSFLLGINLRKAIDAHIVVPKDILNLAGDNVYH